ncbi:c954b0fd-2b92-4817-9c0a-e52a586a7c95 [Sclerotinia trifoliorum]|uniref:C954b0fd-2b92-4817-9c0a-e52a586a7c95 n=1 Tax=Sclerotinia trifoliorum TaxID=28548 RepID=A0A8H2ZP94_9HELO|nr:c954b0fd-2b92-4817-9c0a-e52a586a7c95 [Sclerotinia trifoliorum]
MQDNLMTGLGFEVIDGVVTGDPLLRQEPEGGMQSHAFMLVLDFADAEGRKRRAELLKAQIYNYRNMLVSVVARVDPSRGFTHTSSSNIDDGPHIDPRFLSHPADLKIFSRHIQTLETLRQTKELSAFKHNGKRNHSKPFHIYILDTATTEYHSCGTTAMLPREKGDAVDEKLITHTVPIACA